MRLLPIPIIIIFALPLAAQTTYYVNPAATGTNTGDSWINAFTNLQAALAIAQAGDQVWVKEGIYFPTTSGDRTATFLLKNRVRYYGGFAGTELAPEERDSVNHPTILDGDIGEAGSVVDDVYHVVTAINADSTTTLDGFTVRHGNANGDFEIWGGGIRLIYDSLAIDIERAPRISNCLFTANRAIHGGALGLTTVQAFLPAIRIDNSDFIGNRSFLNGGAVAILNAVTPDQEVSFRKCRFERNRSSSGEGGAVALFTSGDFSFRDCVFDRDSTRIGFLGGAIAFNPNEKDGRLALSGCMFTDCFSSEGGAISVSDFNYMHRTFDFVISDTRFYYNQSAAIAVLNGSDTHTRIDWDDVDISDNYNYDDGAGVYLTNVGSGVFDIRITNSRFTNNLEEAGIGSAFSMRTNNGAAPITNNVLFYNCLFHHNTGAYSIRSGSAATSYSHFINCTLIDNGPRVFRKNWNESDSLKYNIIRIRNSVIIDTTALQRIFYNSTPDTPNLTDYHVDDCLLSQPDCVFAGQNICGASMLFDLDPQFEDGSFVPKPCSPLVDAGNNFWPDTFNILTDLAGNARVLFDTVDIGAFEATKACSSASRQPIADGAPFRLLQNPVSTAQPLTLLADRPIAEEITVEVWDALGRRRLHQSFAKVSDHQVLQLPAMESGGLYWIVIRTGDKRQVLRCIAQKN